MLNGVPVESTYSSFLEYYGYTSRSRVPFLDRILGRNGPDTPALTRTVLPAGADEGATDEVIEAAAATPEDAPEPSKP
ncbi:MAG: hypothetical protein R2701_03510 [Acidimicrobiales bacterium]